MPIYPVTLPPIPIATAWAAEAVFGKGNFYLALGDRISHVFADVNRTDLDGSGKTQETLFGLLALVTIFQFVESLPDRHAVEAMRVRLDWKYALHLPLDHPGLDESALCDFRERLLSNAAGQQTFQCLVDRLAECGLLETRARTDPTSIVAAVCTLSRVERLAEAMHSALEVLAARHPEWLRLVTLPHWYERYDRTPWTLRVKEEQQNLAQEIGLDARYLLDMVAQSNLADLGQLSEVQALAQVCQQQFDQHEGQVRWRAQGCAFCAALRNPTLE